MRSSQKAPYNSSRELPCGISGVRRACKLHLGVERLASQFCRCLNGDRFAWDDRGHRSVWLCKRRFSSSHRASSDRTASMVDILKKTKPSLRSGKEPWVLEQDFVLVARLSTRPNPPRNRDLPVHVADYQEEQARFSITTCRRIKFRWLAPA